MEKSIDQKTKTIVSNIKSIREHKGYTQDYLAAKLKISQNAYSKVELGYSSLSVERLLQIAQILEMEAIDLFDFEAPEAITKARENGIGGRK